jgi:branched-chain amino acid transport system permease protein
MMGYLIAILTFVSLAVLLGFALNVQWGQAGMLNFGLAGFYGVGAYTAAILSKAGVDGLTATLAAIAMTAAISALVSLATLKLREDYLAITTLAFAELVRLVLTNETWLTGGTNGIRDIPRPLVGLVGGDQYELFFLLLCLVLVAATYLLLDRIIRSPFGRALRAVREDDVVAATLGKNVLALRVKAFAIGGAVIGLAGALHAYYFTYIDPGEFAGFVTVYAFMAVIVGGKGSNRGLLLGACTVMVLLEGTRFLKDFVPFLSAQQAASLRLAMIGAGLVLILIFRPEGISSEYRLSIGKSQGETRVACQCQNQRRFTLRASAALGQDDNLWRIRESGRRHGASAAHFQTHLVNADRPRR